MIAATIRTTYGDPLRRRVGEQEGGFRCDDSWHACFIPLITSFSRANVVLLVLRCRSDEDWPRESTRWRERGQGRGFRRRSDPRRAVAPSLLTVRSGDAPTCKSGAEHHRNLGIKRACRESAS